MTAMTRADGGVAAETMALEVSELRYAYRKRLAVDNVTFALAPGAFTVLLGLNGAGKTTLFSLISRLFVTQRGVVRIFGFDVARQPTPALARLGVVFQQPTLDQDLTVSQSMRYHGALHGLPRRSVARRARAELERIGLSDHFGERVRALSGGQRRRIEIARALLHQPRLLLLDEPTVGLDVDSRAAVIRHARALCRDDGVTMLWATHLIDEVENNDDLVVLHDGRLKAAGPADQLRREHGVEDVPGLFHRLTGARAS